MAPGGGDAIPIPRQAASISRDDGRILGFRAPGALGARGGAARPTLFPLYEALQIRRFYDGARSLRGRAPRGSRIMRPPAPPPPPGPLAPCGIFYTSGVFFSRGWRGALWVRLRMLRPRFSSPRVGASRCGRIVFEEAASIRRFYGRPRAMSALQIAAFFLCGTRQDRVVVVAASRPIECPAGLRGGRGTPTSLRARCDVSGPIAGEYGTALSGDVSPKRSSPIWYPRVEYAPSKETVGGPNRQTAGVIPGIFQNSDLSTKFGCIGKYYIRYSS